MMPIFSFITRRRANARPNKHDDRQYSSLPPALKRPRAGHIIYHTARTTSHRYYFSRDAPNKIDASLRVKRRMKMRAACRINASYFVTPMARLPSGRCDDDETSFLVARRRRAYFASRDNSYAASARDRHSALILRIHATADRIRYRGLASLMRWPEASQQDNRITPYILLLPVTAAILIYFYASISYIRADCH